MDLRSALQAFNEGRFEQARQQVGMFLRIQPKHADALYLAAMVEHSTQAHEAALALYERALRANAGHTGAQYGKALLLTTLGRHAEALTHHVVAVRLDPRNPWAHLNHGNSLAATGQYQAAVEAYDRALAIQADLPQVLSNKGNALLGLGQPDRALALFKELLARHPDYADAWINQSYTQLKIEKLEDALASVGKALALTPGSARAWTQQAVILNEQSQAARALVSVDRALELDPHYAEAWAARGDALIELYRHADAIDAYERHLKLAPQSAQGHYKLGLVHADLDRDDPALASYERALAIHPGYAEASMNRGCILFRRLQLTECWDDFESRWHRREQAPAKVKSARPLWTGQASDRPLLLWGEQGIGDQILYASILGELSQLPQKKYLALDARLLGLSARSLEGFELLDLDSVDERLDFAEHLPVGSLPRYFRREIGRFLAAKQPYLYADSARARRLREQIQRSGKLVCGISWRSKRERLGPSKSIELTALVEALRGLPIHFVNLQYGDTREELRQLHDTLGVDVQQVEEVDTFHDIDGLAALIQACDFVISTSNTTVHIAGALGKETFLLLPMGKGRMWYWYGESGRSLWYPSVQMLVQEQPGSWSEPIERLRLRVSEK
ncbi:MAG: tetratricopeptide repeat protein [Curvibacter sp.]|jgi:tetratricopeptide (TPR) repeat protein